MIIWSYWSGTNFFKFTESKISGQKHVCSGLIDISRLILCMSCHILNLIGCCFCLRMFTCNWKIQYFCGKAWHDFTPFHLLALSSRQLMVNLHATLSVNPFHGKCRQELKPHPLIKKLVQSSTWCPFRSTEGSFVRRKEKQWSSTMLSGLFLWKKLLR